MSRYKALNDRAGWLNVHKETGLITVKSAMDRESIFVKDGKYTALIGAYDNGKRGVDYSLCILFFVFFNRSSLLIPISLHQKGRGSTAAAGCGFILAATLINAIDGNLRLSWIPNAA